MDERTALVAVEGDADAASTPRLTREVMEAVATGKTRVVIDMLRVRIADATLIELLAHLVRVLPEPAGRVVAVCSPGSSVRAILRRTGLDKVIEVVADRQEAMARLTGAALN